MVNRPPAGACLGDATRDTYSRSGIDPPGSSLLLQSGGLRLAPFRGGMLYPVQAGNLGELEADIRARADTQYHPVGT